MWIRRAGKFRGRQPKRHRLSSCASVLQQRPKQRHGPPVNIILPHRASARRSVLASPHETLWRRSRAFSVSFLVLFASGCIHPVAESDPDRQRDVALEAQTSKPLKNFSDLNQSGVSFLLTDLDLAMTFMDVADASRTEETTRRNHTNARTAYDTVLHLLEKLTPNADQRQAIDAQLTILKTRLEAIGQQF
jgi:hypothetical protein